MGISNLTVILEPYLPVYFSGQQVSGHVYINLDSNTAIRELVVSIKGNSHVRWTDGSQNNTRSHTAQEDYLKFKSIIWNGAHHEGNMQQGNFKFPFSFTLPVNIPSSFEGTYGNVRYKVKTTADRAFNFDKTHSIYFSVNALYNLNIIPMARNPLSIILNSTAGIFFCRAGPVLVNLYIGKSGFVSGETLVINGTVKNDGHIQVLSTLVKIVQTITYKTPSRSRDEKREVAKVFRPQIDPGATCHWSNVGLVIPAVVPSELQHCNLIVVSYVLKFIADMGPCQKVKGKQMILIGSIPLTGMPTPQPQAQPQVFPPPMPSAPPQGDLPADRQYLSDLPPAYCDVVDDDQPPPYGAPCTFSSSGRAGKVPKGFAPVYLAYHGVV